MAWVGKDWFRTVVTLIIFGLVVWWLIVVMNEIATPPKVDSAGTVIIDEFQRAKDILLVVFPLATAAVGYWLGAEGKSKAEGEATRSRSQLTAVVGASEDPELLKKAKDKYPDAFR